jgi:histidinol-phosphate phosphatase family protein
MNSGWKLVFLDRDGVINKYPGDREYVTSWKNFKFLPYVKDALKNLTQAGYKIFIASNQAGVTKGIYSKRALAGITAKMLKDLRKQKINIDGVYYCIHRNEDNCSCRKPKTGLLEKALKDHKIPRVNLKHSFFIGDTVRDISTGKNAGCKTILVFTGKEKAGNKKEWEIQPDFVAKNLKEAVDIVLKRNI